MDYKIVGEKLGFELNKNVYYKNIEDFYVYFKDWQYLIYKISSAYIPLNKAITKEEVKRIEKAAFDNAGARYTLGIKDDTLIISLNETKKKDPSYFDKINEELVRVCKLLRHDGYSAMEVCPVCKQKGEYNRFGDDFCPVHDKCITSHIETLKLKAKQEEGFNIKYIYSLLLSLVFGLIGLIPAVLLTIFNHEYFTAVVVLCPVLTVLGYYLIKAPNKRWLRYLTGGIACVLVIAFTIYAIITISAYNSLSVGEYLSTWNGIKKIIFSSLFSLGGFGLTKFLQKFIKNYQEELKKFD